MTIYNSRFDGFTTTTLFNAVEGTNVIHKGMGDVCDVYELAHEICSEAAIDFPEISAIELIKKAYDSREDALFELTK